MARNTLSDLNNHLFAQLERLNDDKITKEQVEIEAKRTKAINGIAKNVIDNARIELDAIKIAYESLPGDKSLPCQFGISKHSEKE